MPFDGIMCVLNRRLLVYYSEVFANWRDVLLMFYGTSVVDVVCIYVCVCVQN